MSHFTRKAAIAAVAFATVGSTVFGGAALANDKKGDDKHGKKGVELTQTATAGDAPGGGNIGRDCVAVANVNFGSVVGLVDPGDDANQYNCSPVGNTGGNPTALNRLGG